VPADDAPLEPDLADASGGRRFRGPPSSFYAEDMATTSAGSWQRDLASEGSSTAEVAMQYVLAVTPSTGVHPPSAVAVPRLTFSRACSRRGLRPLHRRR
jgi:hypothetical protein